MKVGKLSLMHGNTQYSIISIIAIHSIIAISYEMWKYFVGTISRNISNVVWIAKLITDKYIILDVDPQRDDDASPMSTYRCMLRPTWMLISALQHKSKYKSNSISNFFEKKNQIFWFPCCSTREDLSIDVSITNVGLISTKLRLFQLFSTSQNSNFELFWKKIKFLGSHAVVLVKTFPLMYQLLM